MKKALSKLLIKEAEDELAQIDRIGSGNMTRPADLIVIIIGNQVSPTNVMMKMPKVKFGISQKNFSRTTIHMCARNGDLNQLKELLRLKKYRAKINKLDGNGMAPLHYAARANNLDITNELLSVENSDPMIRDSEGATPLHYAARRKEYIENDLNPLDSLSVIKELIDEHECDVNAQDKYGSTPLHICAMRGNQVVAQELLGHPDIQINLSDNLGCTPLHEAATYNHQTLTQLLVENGANVALCDGDGCTALHLAAIEGHTEIVRQILESDISEQLINMPDNEETMPLHYAVEAKSLPTMEILLQRGAIVDAPCRITKSGCFPIHLASIAGDIEGKAVLTNCLLFHGADVSAVDLSGGTALHKAAQYDSAEDAKQLIKKMEMDIDSRDEDNYTSLMTAAAYGSKEVVTELLSRGADISVVDFREKSVIYLAVENDQFEILKVIFKYLASQQVSEKKKRISTIDKIVNYCDRQGDSPLHVAAFKGNIRIVRILLRHDADMNLKNDNEETPFLKACMEGHVRVVSEMLKKNEKLLNDEDENSNTPLHVAAEGGHLEVVKKLVECGAKKDARNNRSRTPLDLSAQAGHIDIVEYFLDEDVAPDPLDKEKVTPLQMASKCGHESVVSLLIERGADVGCTDVEGNNCLDIAIEYDQKSVVRAILKSSAWYIALANDSSDTIKNEGTSDTSEPKQNYYTLGITPLRKLFRKMPDMALVALNRFVEPGEEKKEPFGRKKYFDFNYDFLDDSYTDYGKIRDNDYFPTLKSSNTQPMLQKSYNYDLNHVKNNHPLTILIRENRDNLLGHSAVLTLIRNKWRIARAIYFIYMAIFLLYVSLITSFMLIAEPPFNINMTECEEAIDWDITRFESHSRFVIWILAGLGLVKEIYQLYLQRSWYLEFPNLLDWYSYVSAILLMCTFTNCGARTDWQWQMGAFTILFTWLDLILFLRRLPGLGIYVVMITEIWQTFMKFFVALFLFVLSFALTFHILAQDQDEFSTEFYSITKSFVMMIGEFDYGDIFFNEDEPLIYRNATFAVFLLFAFMVSIIVMNLMIGLAVDDVYGLREHAKVVKLAMQIELALDVELALPSKFRRKFRCHRRRYRFYPTDEITGIRSIMNTMKGIIEGPLLSEKAVKKSLSDQIHSGRLPELMLFEEKMTSKMKKLKTEVRSNSDKLSTLLEKIDILIDEKSQTKT